uniref:Sulfotransfer_1 domain-containing protein n=1 Tax=Panagrellus redivivus TaxID=6233 RepID=A0A7E4ZYV1_PANRE
MDALLTNYKPRLLDFRYSSSGIDKDITFSTLVGLFPHVICIRIGKAYFNWLDDLNGTRKQYRTINIIHDDFDKLFSFKPPDLYDFVKSQPPIFSISLTYRVSVYRYHWIIHMMNKFIDPRFSDAKNGFCKVTLRVELFENIRIYRDHHYYYKN